MKAILIPTKIPPYLKFGKKCDQPSFVKHLLHPYVPGEVVKVCKVQEPSPKSKMNVWNFRKRYVCINRKNPETGKWDIFNEVSWEHVELLSSDK